MLRFFTERRPGIKWKNLEIIVFRGTQAEDAKEFTIGGGQGWWDQRRDRRKAVRSASWAGERMRSIPWGMREAVAGATLAIC